MAYHTFFIAQYLYTFTFFNFDRVLESLEVFQQGIRRDFERALYVHRDDSIWLMPHPRLLSRTHCSLLSEEKMDNKRAVSLFIASHPREGKPQKTIKVYDCIYTKNVVALTPHAHETECTSWKVERAARAWSKMRQSELNVK